MAARDAPPPPIEIRPATPADLPAVALIARAAYAPYVARIGREPAPMVADFAAHQKREELFVLTCGGEVAGYIVHYPSADHIHVENVAVAPGLHGEGLGSRLLDHAQASARRQGLAAMELYTNIRMTENLSYYPRLGFIETGRRTADGFERVYFRKPL